MKKTTIILSIIAISVAMTAFTAKKTAGDWTLDQLHSSMTFVINHFGSPFLGKFNKFDGKLIFDPNDLGKANADFTIDANSIETFNEQRNGHVKGADFLDAAKYPSITFKSEKFTKKKGNEYTVTGKLTVKETTKTVELPLIITAMKDHPFYKDKKILGVKILYTLKRSEYKIGAGDFATDAVLSDEIVISYYSEFNQTK
jgi:polyisoprenoid-binding protein YceI